jgi:predicted DCC family thiol-disulfide oxidoreductase YuxK
VTPGGEKILIFDGDCAFCKLWVEFWRTLTGNSVEYTPYQTAAGVSAQIPREEARSRVQFLSGGERYQGAAAVFQLLSGLPAYAWLAWAWKKLPGFAFISERVYSFIAAHRNAAYRVARLLWGRRIERPSYAISSALFARSMALIYAFAFASFGMQVRGLIGSDGILPVRNFLGAVRANYGGVVFWRLPTLFWWANTDYTLLSIAWSGFAIALVTAISRRPQSGYAKAAFALLWFYYLSIVMAGQIFMSYQWDLLLLEAGFLTIFLRAAWPRIWLFQWLIFRLMFESGLVKLQSGDPTWRNLTALAHHYQTQPLPTVLAWYMFQLPLWFQKVSTFFTFVVELGLPLLMLGPRRCRRLAAAGTIALQLLIFLTGNYTFFNLLAIALSLFLFDDAFWRDLFRRPARNGAAPAVHANSAVTAVLFAAIMLLSCTQLMAMFGTAPRALTTVADAAAPFGVVNGYGLFAVMTTSRPEIEIEGSNDGITWEPYVFRYKAGPLNRAPGWIAPLQPRLDWQMWFAALGTYRDNPWFLQFVLKLLQGSKPVLALIERDPFAGSPPLHIRATAYDYRFTTFEERRRTGNWWKRELLGPYLPPVSLKGR